MSDFPPPPLGSIPPPPDMTPPPPYGHHGAALGYAMPTRPFGRIGGISKVLGGLLAAMAVVQVFGIIGGINSARRARQFLDGAIKEDAFNRVSGMEMLSTVTVPLTVVLGIVTIIWMFGLAKNLRSMGRPGLDWAPGWAVGGWFAPPCVLYVVPWLMLKELWKASDPDLAPSDSSWKQRQVTPLLHVWWVLFGFVPIIGIALALSASWGALRNAMQNGFDEDEALTAAAQSVVDGRIGSLVVGVSQVAAAVIFMVIVRQLADRHMRCTGEA